MKAAALISLSPQARARSGSGAALVITLVVVVLMSIMVISLSEIVRIERGASHSHLEKARAEMLAQTGAAKVVASLRKETANPNRNWISQPGQLVASSAAVGGSKVLIDPPIALSSGAPVSVTATTTPAVLRPAQLNVPTFEQGSGGGIAPHLITNLPDPANPAKAVPMAVRWIYVRQDGSEDVQESPTLNNAANPIVGRYAYWTDDESSKVNYNLAWTRGTSNPNPASHPTRINLPTLFGAADPDAEGKAAAIHFYDPVGTGTPSTPSTTTAYQALTRFFFQTPEDARQVERIKPGVDAALLANRFNVTHYNHDPDTTFFNEPRIVLTTQPERAGWKLEGGVWVGTNKLPWKYPNVDSTGKEVGGKPYFLHVVAINPNTGKLYTDAWDTIEESVTQPYRGMVDEPRLDEVIKMLNSYLQRTDWPMAAGSSLQAKYFAGKPNRLTQLSLNIINYVRTKESEGEPTTKIVVPIRGEHPAGGKFDMMEVATSANAYMGITRTPKVTEGGVWVNSSPTSGTTYSIKYKVEIFLPKNFGLDSLNLTKLRLWTPTREDNIAAADIENPQRAGDPVIYAGEYAIITKSSTALIADRSNYTPALRFALSFASNSTDPAGNAIPTSGRRIEVVPLGSGAPYKVDPAGTPEKDISSIEVDDPRVNTHKDDWKQNTKNTFGKPNSISKIGSAPTATGPQQDTDSGGNITDISFYMPPPKGRPGNVEGIVSSAGELGYIHTGMESGAGAGIPWRTLRLQPNKQAASILPDWAFMDLFTVPADVPPDVAGKPSPRAIYSPHGTATGGRVNMNAKPAPFDLDRVDPLVAVFEGATHKAYNPAKLSNSAAKAIADAVYRRTLATSGKQYGYQGGYDSPGEVVEMKGVADGGEESEQLVREIANLITSRGNVFSVYTVGQALKQTPSGKLIVTGEQRQQAMIERYAEGATVRFRPVFYRNLTP